MKHLQLTSRELEEYEEEIEKVMKRYVKRLQWLMSGKLGWIACMWGDLGVVGVVRFLVISQ